MPSPIWCRTIDGKGSRFGLLDKNRRNHLHGPFFDYH